MSAVHGVGSRFRDGRLLAGREGGEGQCFEGRDPEQGRARGARQAARRRDPHAQARVAPRTRPDDDEVERQDPRAVAAARAEQAFEARQEVAGMRAFRVENLLAQLRADPQPDRAGPARGLDRDGDPRPLV